jgi:DNA-binding transcriptional ArsR family regulator
VSLSSHDQSADQVLDALGNQTRRDILTLLRSGPLTVGAIAEHLPISRPAVSKHLRILQEADLVAYNESGTRNIFYLRPVGFRAARAYLDLFWDEALANFQRIAAETGQSDL